MTDRNVKRKILKNGAKGYSEIIGKRGLSSAVQYGKLRIPDITLDERKSLQTQKHIYKTGDKLYKISYSYYGDTKYWWVIAWFNRKPTDFHCKIGDTIYVPFPLKQALYLANRD